MWGENTGYSSPQVDLAPVAIIGSDLKAKNLDAQRVTGSSPVKAVAVVNRLKAAQYRASRALRLPPSRSTVAMRLSLIEPVIIYGERVAGTVLKLRSRSSLVRRGNPAPMRRLSVRRIV